VKRLVSKTKAIAKILIGVVVASFLGSIITVSVMLVVRAGTLGLAIGMLIMIGAVMVGAMLGSKWAKKNIADKKEARNVALWSALIFLVVNILVSGIGVFLSSTIAGIKTNFLTQAAQITAQSFMIYAASRYVMNRLIKKENNE
jgi:MFS family permease